MNFRQDGTPFYNAEKQTGVVTVPRSVNTLEKMLRYHLRNDYDKFSYKTSFQIEQGKIRNIFSNNQFSLNSKMYQVCQKIIRSSYFENLIDFNKAFLRETTLKLHKTA